MPAASARVPLSTMREALTARVQATSLRSVAREVGMSPSGLKKVLHGSNSYSPTLRKLERWYVRERGRYGGTLDADAVTAALRVLVQDLPPGMRPALLERLIAELESGYSAAGGTSPPWMDGVRREVGAD